MTNSISEPMGRRLTLSHGEAGKTYQVVKIAGRDETIKHINDLGLIVDSKVTLINAIAGNMILNIKEARIGIGKDLADKVTVIEVC